VTGKSGKISIPMNSRPEKQPEQQPSNSTKRYTEKKTRKLAAKHQRKPETILDCV
jgi:hypothetical protein